MRGIFAALALLCLASTSEAKTHSFQPHPKGCPHHSFCGCGVSVRVFGHPVRTLYLAANWLRFPKAQPSPGMVAARYGHVFYIERVIRRDLVLAYDPNSGGHRTRVHVRALAGFRVVNPHRG